MKLEVGMYCYDKTNRKLGIGKIINFQRNNNVNIRYKNDIELVSIGNVKASHNIIDLIEVGDYVNGTKVTSISGTRYDKNDLHCYCDYCQNEKTGKWLMIPAKDIKSIVTKEQFSQMEYKVVE